MMNYYQVATNFPKLESILTYGSEDSYERGDLVEVPLGRRKAGGVILETANKEDLAKFKIEKIKSIIKPIDNSFSITQKELVLYEWMSKYYHYSLGKLIFDSLPKFLKRPRKIDLISGKGEGIPFTLNADQAHVVETIKSKMFDGFKQNFVHGVTGSGKSAVYMHLMKEAITAGKSVQFLLPEINLTPQFTEMFTTYLDCPVYTFHSGVTASEKYTIWKELREKNEPVLVMGVRSSIFLPIDNLGLVIVDEEHDQSFKQTDRCTYNGRDVAIKKAQIHGCNILLGSATPSVENYYNFEQSLANRAYFTLVERVGEANFPSLEILDTRNRFKEDDPAWPLLDETIDQIEAKVDNGEQVLVFINKLGFSSFIQCRNCSHQFINKNCGCENNLRFFKQKNLLSCAHCEFKMPAPSECPECGGISLMNKGFGTEKVEQVLKEIFPKYTIDRFDRDEIKTTKDLKEKLNLFHSKKIDILVGTQMLAKGHNFKNVNLVVILGIDSMLNYADFRSNEKTYQLLEQVAGRAGRYSQDSKVIVQTINPEHSLFKLVQEHSFDQFYKDELPLREICACPPFTKMTMLYFSSRFRDKVIAESTKVFAELNRISKEHFKEVKMFGPTPMGIEKKANQFTWAIMFKSANFNELHGLISTFESNYKAASNVTCKVDIDPIHIL